MTSNISQQDKPASLRDNSDYVEKALMEAHGVLNDIMGTVPSVTNSSDDKQPDGYIYQLAVKYQNNCALVSNLLLRLTDLRDKL
jgi:hypothetical protein